MKKISKLFLLLFLALGLRSIGQETCASATPIKFSGLCTGEQGINSGTKWYSFRPESQQLNLVFSQIGSPSTRKITRVKIYSGTSCTALYDMMAGNWADNHDFYVFGEYFTPGDTYYMRVESEIDPTPCQDCSNALFFTICSIPIQNIPYDPTEVQTAPCEMVNNGGFETNSNGFPVYGGEINYATGWTSANTGTADYFATTATGPFDIPNNSKGMQAERTGGIGYAGIGVSNIPGAATQDSREYVATKLKCPIVAGRPYKVSFYYSLADYSSCGVGNLSVLLYNGSLQLSTSNLVITPPANSQRFDSPTSSAPGYLVDMTNWVKIEWSFVSNNNYTNLLIGSFLNEAQTDTVHVNNTFQQRAYYYIDDVSLQLDMPNLSVNSTAPLPLCFGESTTLTATGNLAGSVYTWQPATGLNTTVGAQVVANPTVTTTYTVTSTSATCNCTLTQTVTVGITTPLGIFVNNGQCRKNYTLTATGGCLYTNSQVVWNVGGVIYTGNPATVDLPGNSTSVPITLQVLGANGSVIMTESTTITNVETLGAAISYTTDGCGNITLTATPNPCVPANTYFTWYQPSTGITNVGNPITFTPNPSTSVFTVFMGIENTSGTVLITPVQFSLPISQIPNTGNCCPNNNICLNRTGPCTPITYTSTATAALSGTHQYNYQTITVMPNVIMSIAAGSRITFNNCTFLFRQGSGIELSRTTDTLVFNGCYLHGCSQLWKGIKFDFSSQSNTSDTVSVTFKNSMIEDAITAFDFTQNRDFVSFKVSGAIFNKNIAGIKFINAREPGLFGAQNRISVTNTVFSCKNFTYPSTGFVNIFNGQASYTALLASAGNATPLTAAGVPYYAKSLQGMSLEGAVYGSTQYFPASGKINASTNLIYDNLIQGIAIKGLNMPAFTGNKFLNITSPVNGGDHPNIYSTKAAAIYYSGQSAYGTTYPYQTVKIGGNVPGQASRNKFTNCYYGVYAKDEPVDVTTNDFTNCYNGVYMANAIVPPANNGSVNSLIRGNTMVNTKYTGYYFYQNNSVNVNLSNNSMTYSSAANYNFTSRAVQIHEFNQPAAAKYIVQNNTFTKVFEGISVNNANGTFVEDNTIRLNSDLPSFNFNGGIVLINTKSAAVTGNTIYGNGNQYAFQECGIRGSVSPQSTITCNTIRNSFTGFGFHGASSSDVFKNDIYNAKYGVWNAYSAAIGNQDNPILAANGFSGQPSENRWFNTGAVPISWHTFMAVSSDGMQSKFFTRNSYPHTMLLNGSDGPPSMTPQPVNPTLLPYIGCNNIGGLQAGRLMRLAPEIAQDVLYPITNVVGRNVSKRALLNNLIEDNINTQGNVMLDDFKNTEMQSMVGKFYKIDERIKVALALNDSVMRDSVAYANDYLSASDSVEMLQKQVNNIYFHYLKNNYEINDNDLLELDAIAKLCPYQYGTSVFQARSLVNPYSQNFTYLSECEKLQPAPESNNRIMAPESIEESVMEADEKSVAVYPNPNNGTFNVLVKTDVQTVTLTLYSVLGTKVLEAEYNLSEDGIISVKQDLKEGAYILNVSIKGLTIGTERVIITK